jgi:WD40 repeat protein
MRFRPDSRTLDFALGNGDVIRYDGLTGKAPKRFVADWRTPEQKRANRPSQPDLWEGDFSVDGRILVTSAEAWLYVWDVEAGKLLRKLRHPHEHGCHVALSPDARTVATSDLYYSDDPGQDQIRLYNIETGRQTLALDPGDNRAVVLAFSPDGGRLFTGFMRGSGAVWDVRKADGKRNEPQMNTDKHRSKQG